ncbi:DedA family protein [Desulfovibrio sp. OttesenSCG-928-C14]|nr:DedA family protein [Desulfovibrio sp. OttesenSCG-928-C14]
MDLNVVLDLLNEWGYLLIVGWTFLEGETIVVVAGFMAQQEVVNLNPWLIALAAFIGSFCSDQLMFSLGKYKGVAVLNRFPRLAKNTTKARRLLVKYETALILGFRFVYGVRNVTPILLGISGVKHIKFFALNLLGAGVWALSFSFGGYYFGELLETLAERFPYAKYVILGLVIALVLCLFMIKRIRKRKALRDVLKVSSLEGKSVRQIIREAKEKSRASGHEMTDEEVRELEIELGIDPDDPANQALLLDNPPEPPAGAEQSAAEGTACGPGPEQAGAEQAGQAAGELADGQKDGPEDGGKN